MKKLIILLLVLTGMVGTASATTLHIGMEKEHSVNGVYVYRYGGVSPDTWDNSQQATLEGDLYGRRWYSVDMNGNNSAVVKFDDGWSKSTDITSISGDDYYIYVSTTSSGTFDNNENKKIYSAGQLSGKGWTTMKFSNNVEGKWDDAANECTKVNDDTFTYTLTKTQIDAANPSEPIYFRFKLANGVFFVSNNHWNNNYFRIGASDPNSLLNIANSTTSISYTTDQEKNWYVPVPSYDYDKLVFTITNTTSGSDFSWQISADAYIAKTISSVGKATFGCGADVDFSGVEGLTAEKAKVNTTTGKITYTNASTLEAGEGALLSGEAGTYYIPVAVSGDYADTEHNDLIGVTADKTNFKGDDGYNCYILANRVQNGESGADAELGFYKVNSTTGNNVRAGSAYLRTATGGAYAPEFFPLFTDSETTGINAVKGEGVMVYGSAFNLAGQRVANPTKGLYIVNGRKVVLK